MMQTAAARRALEADLLEAHRRRDGPALARLYAQAADAMLAEDRLEAASFYLTQAYVFSLESGATSSSDLKQRLIALGRETDT